MEQKLRALIVDDEEGARRLLSELLEETLYFNEIRLAHSVVAANNELAVFYADMIFLDIKMPGKDGFSLVNDLRLKKMKTGIVFVTAFEQYAIQAIKNQAFDYLLKPVNRKELKQCITRYIEKMNAEKSTEKSESISETQIKINRIRINTRTGIMFINPVNILYCKADGNYTTICTGDKNHLCSMNLGRVAELLPGNGFIRVGRSHIINFEHITILDRKKSQVTLARNGDSVSLNIPRQHLKDLDLI